MTQGLLEQIASPADLRRLDRSALDRLAVELRAFILESVSKTGGHLSSNLGTVELTIALHYVFDTPHDRVVWDVGHQSYPHKILTGRREQMSTLQDRRAGIVWVPKVEASLSLMRLARLTLPHRYLQPWAWPWPLVTPRFCASTLQ